MRMKLKRVGTGLVIEILLRPVIGQSPVLEFGVMAAGFPLQLFRSVFDLIAGGLFADNPKDLGFRHSGSKLGKPVVHLTANACQKSGNSNECSIHGADFTGRGCILQPCLNAGRPDGERLGMQ
jgi:hypothetical protein